MVAFGGVNVCLMLNPPNDLIVGALGILLIGILGIVGSFGVFNLDVFILNIIWSTFN